MSDTELNLEKATAVGTLDRLATNVAMAFVAVVPTFLLCIFKPWRVAPLLTRDDPEGRLGMVLAPGAFFPLGLLVAFMASALVSTPEAVNINGAFLGPAMALSIQSAFVEGDVWKIVSIVMPIYGFSVFVGSLGMLLKPLIEPEWSLRISLRMVFYVTTVTVALIILTSTAIDLYRLTTTNDELGRFLYSVTPIPVVSVAFWMYLWMFRGVGVTSWARSLGLAAVMMGLNFGTVFLVDFLIRL